MSTLVTIQGSDVIATSRTDINANFTALNNGKLETSLLTTTSDLSENSDLLIPSQKAVKNYVDSGGQQNASETVRGLVEEATDAEIVAGTDTGSSGAKLFAPPSKLNTQIDAKIASSVLINPSKVIIPYPVVPLNPQATQMGVLTDWSTATTMQLGLISIPHSIIVNKVSVRTGTMTGAMTLDITLYSEDGQTKTVLVADGAIADTEDNVIHTFSVSAISLKSGNYYLAFNVVDASGGMLAVWDTDATIPFSATAGLAEDVTSEPILQGTLTITSGTPPATIDPTAITPVDNKILIVRLDN